MAKSINSKLRTLYVMQELLEKSDENNRIPTKAFLEMLEKNGISADRKSLYDDIETLSVWGMDILYSKEKPAGYFVASRDFEMPELKLLVDAVQASKFITAKKSHELIKKLEGLTSKGEAKQLQRQVFVTNRIKTPNEDIWYNVDKIHEGMINNSKISFNYYKWNTDKELVARNGGKPFVISPWALTWDDENYYMLGYDDQVEMVKYYRVDKMQHTKVTGNERKGKEAFDNFDIGRFAKRTFGMFGGEDEVVCLECDNSLIGAILDRFGTDAIISKLGEDRFRINVEVAVSGQFYGWIFGLGDGVKIAGPEHVAREFTEWLDRARSKYGED